MSVYGEPGGYPMPQRQPSRADAIDAGRLWAGGAAAALVAGGVAVVGYLIVRGLLEIEIVGARLSGAVVQPTMLAYAGVAVLAAILATGLMHVLLLTTPRPRAFFGWIIALATIVSMLVPLALDQPLEARVATAAVNLVIGIAVGTLVSMSATASLRGDPRVVDDLLR